MRVEGVPAPALPQGDSGARGERGGEDIAEGRHVRLHTTRFWRADKMNPASTDSGTGNTGILRVRTTVPVGP